LVKSEEIEVGLKDISAESKVKIALEAIIGEVIGRSSGEIAQRYPGVSTRAVTQLKNQALAAIREVFTEGQGAIAPALMSEEEISAGLDRLLGSSSVKCEAAGTSVVAVQEIVSAMMKYNDRAGKGETPRIYISKAIVQEFGHHDLGEINEYFVEHKAEIDKHNLKHGLKRTTNRAIKGQDWQSWLEI
jgi:ribosomal protein S13